MIKVPVHLSLLALVLWAGWSADRAAEKRARPIKVLCLLTRFVVQAGGAEKHKVQNEVWLAK